jgi:hypothetical protein
VHRRVDLVVAVLGTVDAETITTLTGLRGIETIAVTTRGAAHLAPGFGITIVDASTVDFPAAWNRTFSRWSVARA